MDELEKALKLLLAEFSKGGEAQSQVLNAMQTHARPVYQFVYNAGHGVATASEKTRRDELETQLASANTALAAEQKARKAAEEKAPDVAAVHAQYATQNAETERQNKAKLEKATARIDALRKGKVEEQLFNRLTSKEGGNMAPKYARVLAKQIVDSRVKFDGDNDAEYKIMQAKLPNIPIAVTEGQDVLDVVVKEAAADPENEPFILSKVDGGSGTRQGAPGGSTSTEPQVLKDFRASKDAEHAARAALNPLLPAQMPPATGAAASGSVSR